jgi:NitT/TauT family transport system permease protein
MIIGQSAVAGIEPRLDEVGRALRLNLWARVTKIVLPAALPRFFVAFRLAASAALIVAVTVEIVANPLGLGYGLMLAQQTLHPDQMFALLIWVGIVGWGLNALLLFMQRRLFGAVAPVAQAR